MTLLNKHGVICDFLRNQLDVTAYSHTLFVFLLERFRGVSAVALKDVLHNQSRSHEVVPKSAEFTMPPQQL